MTTRELLMFRRILFLVSSMGSGGAERVAANLVNSWVEIGYEVTLLITYSGRGECEYEISKKVKVIYLADEIASSRCRTWNNFKRILALRKIIQDHNDGVVVSFLTNVNVAALLAGVFLDTKIIVSERIYPPMLPLGWSLEILRRLFYPFADGVVMLTSEGLNWLRKEIPAAKGCIIPNPIVLPLSSSIPFLQPSDWVPNDRKLLLSVGRLDEQKGFECLIRAFSKLSCQHSDWDLVILGEGPLAKYLMALVEMFGLLGRVHFPGRVGNVSVWYERADIYVLSSLFEGFPNTLGEAMSHGCAVVSFDCETGPRDMICDEVSGILVKEVGNSDQLIKGLKRLMEDDLLRTRISENALHVRQRYSISSILYLWEKLFLRIGV